MVIPMDERAGTNQGILLFLDDGMSMNHTRIIQLSFGVIFIIISFSSFALSYLNLTAAAIEAGITPLLAPLWPLCLDAFIVMGSLFVLQANMSNEPAWQGWITLLCFTVISTGFNIAHSPDDTISQAAHAIPPIALCGSLELLMIRIKRDLTYRITITGEQSIVQEIEERIDAAKFEKVKNYFTMNPEASVNKARMDLRMNHTTVKNIRHQLISAGVIQDLSE